MKKRMTVDSAPRTHTGDGAQLLTGEDQRDASSEVRLKMKTPVENLGSRNSLQFPFQTPPCLLQLV